MAAIALAAKLFGQEAVLFVDVGSYKTMIRRRFMRPSLTPSLSQALVFVALLFPISFYAQSILFRASVEHLVFKLKLLALVQFLGLFILVPLAVCGYFKINIASTFRLRLPPARGVAWRDPAGLIEFPARPPVPGPAEPVPPEVGRDGPA